MAARIPDPMSVDCISCGEHFGPGDRDMHLATIKYGIRLENAPPQMFDVLDEDGQAVRYAPLFFDAACWKEVEEGLAPILEDQPPLNHPEELLWCNYCSSSILEAEYCCYITTGALEPSRRPTGAHFIAGGDAPTIMCLSCMAHVGEEVLEVWLDVAQQGECAECEHIRCWRGSVCELACDCHDMEEEEEDNALYERGETVKHTLEFRRRLPPHTDDAELEGTVLRDQEDAEDEVDVRWNDGSLTQVHRSTIMRA